MASFAQLIHCKKVDIMDDEGHVLCSAEVTSDSANSLLVILPRSFNYRAQESFKTLFYDPIRGLVTCRSRFSSPLPLPDAKVSVRCYIVQSISQQNRRTDLKVPVFYNTLAKVEQTTLSGIMDHTDPYPAELVNISAGGVYIKLPVLLFRFNRISFVFDADGKEIPLTAEVLRVEDCSQSASKPLFGYGCRFVDLAPQYESALRSYVLRREKILHEKKK